MRLYVIFIYFSPAICRKTASWHREVKIQLHFNLNNGNLFLLMAESASELVSKVVGIVFAYFFLFVAGSLLAAGTVGQMGAKNKPASEREFSANLQPIENANN